MSPILIDIPVPILTPRLLIRPPQAGDGKALNEAVLDSFEELKTWMPWAQERPSVDDSEIVCRRAYAKFVLREDLMLFLFDRATGEFLGGSGLHRIDWEVPRFEIGYWIRVSRQGQGLVRESTNALTRFAFGALAAKRVEIRCDEQNLRSVAVIESLGFPREGLFKNNEAGGIRNTLVYARTDLSGLPELDVHWGLP